MRTLNIHSLFQLQIPMRDQIIITYLAAAAMAMAMAEIYLDETVTF